MNPPGIKKTLIVFVKAPVPGEVKTRLLPHLDGKESAELYSCFVRDILKKVSKLPALRVLIAYQPHPRLIDLSWTLIQPSPDFFKQEGKSLGERLTHAFGIAFGRGAQQTVVIGSDAPSLSADLIEQAFKSLNGADLVLGPAADGGYYLIGLSRPSLQLFEEMSWSTDQVFECASKNALALGYKLRVLSPHYDVDTLEDLHKLHGDLSHEPTLAPLTEKFLSHLFKTKLQPVHF